MTIRPFSRSAARDGLCPFPEGPFSKDRSGFRRLRTDVGSKSRPTTAASRTIPVLAVLFALAFGPFAAADNWPMWRGPSGNGVANESAPPTQWSADENVVWKTEIKGYGSSTPAVWDDRIFLTTQTEDEKEYVVGLDRATGAILWERLVGQGFTKSRAGANMASASPATDGELVVSTFGTGELVCHDRDGKEIWKRDLEDDHGKFTIWWGYSNSPVLHGDKVFVTVVNEGPSYLLALDKRTGETIWKTERKTEAKSEPCDSYATPLVYTVGGREEVFVTGALWATAYAPADGRLLWKANIGGDRTILSPTFDDGSIYVTAGKRGPIFRIEAGGEGDVTDSRVRWSHEKSTPDVPSLLVVGELLFAVNDTGIAMCFRKETGEQMWQERLGGNFSCSPVAAAGLIYFTNQDGLTKIVRAADKFEVVAENSIGEEAALASLAMSDGQIFQRSRARLYCIGERKK